VEHGQGVEALQELSGMEYKLHRAW